MKEKALILILARGVLTGFSSESFLISGHLTVLFPSYKRKTSKF